MLCDARVRVQFLSGVDPDLSMRVRAALESNIPWGSKITWGDGRDYRCTYLMSGQIHVPVEITKGWVDSFWENVCAIGKSVHPWGVITYGDVDHPTDGLTPNDAALWLESYETTEG